MTAGKDIPVGTLCAMYGLNPNTLRTWERRYDFPSPARGAGGQRTYSAADIALIGEIMELIRGGMAPAKAIEQARGAQPRRPAAAAAAGSILETSLSRGVLEAVRSHDQATARALLRKALDKMGYRAFVETWAFPLLSHLGHNWEMTGMGVADEHSFTMMLEGLILEYAHGLTPRVGAPVVTLACAPGEAHQLPVLHLANLITEAGIARPLVLAAGLPMEETLAASKTAEARIVVISATIAPSSAETRAWVKTCVEAGWADRIILAGPGFMRSRVYSDYPVKAAAGTFEQSVQLLRTVLGSSGSGGSASEPSN